MAPPDNTLSVNEVATVANVSPRMVNELVDRAILPSRFVVRGRPRALRPEACYLVAVYLGTSDRLTKDERVRVMRHLSAEFEHAHQHDVPSASRWRLKKSPRHVFHEDFLTVDLRPFIRKVEKGGDLLNEARAMVVEDPDVMGGMPVIKGTRILVHDVAASVRKGIPSERILKAWPDLTDRGIALAKIYADANPPRGRPRRVADDVPDALLRSVIFHRRVTS